jgi:hypothetical protein
VHEVGHLLDIDGLGPPKRSSAASMDSILEEWRGAVTGSEAVGRLRGTLRAGLLAGVFAERDQAFLRYLLRPQELWSRSYAQYIGSRGGDLLLTKQLQQARTAVVANMEVSMQWDAEDFAAISAAIDRLFRSEGWCR